MPVEVASAVVVVVVVMGESERRTTATLGNGDAVLLSSPASHAGADVCKPSWISWLCYCYTFCARSLSLHIEIVCIYSLTQTSLL